MTRFFGLCLICCGVGVVFVLFMDYCWMLSLIVLLNFYRLGCGALCYMLKLFKLACFVFSVLCCLFVVSYCLLGVLIVYCYCRF